MRTDINLMSGSPQSSRRFAAGICVLCSHVAKRCVPACRARPCAKLQKTQWICRFPQVAAFAQFKQKRWARWDSNPGPKDYESSALTD